MSALGGASRFLPALVAGTCVLIAGAALSQTAPRKEISARSVVSSGVAELQPGEEMPGGEATSRGTLITADAFSQLSGNMGFARELDFKVGNGLFRKNWVSAPSSTKSSDGLGPLFNARACQSCHLKDGRAPPPQARRSRTGRSRCSCGFLFRQRRMRSGPPWRRDASASCQSQRMARKSRSSASRGIAERGECSSTSITSPSC